MINVTPLTSQFQFQPASLELHLGGDEPLFMPPGHFVLAHTLETVSIGAYHVAQVNGKSSWGRLGILVHATAGFVDPGFRGQITLELKNLHHDKAVVLPAGAAICQLVFSTLNSPPSRLYGDPGLRSHYQNQTGTTPSWIE